MTEAEKVQNRYVRLGDKIAELAAEAAALEKAMEDGGFTPLSLGVYNGLAAAHRCIIHPCLSTLASYTGVQVEVTE